MDSDETSKQPRHLHRRSDYENAVFNCNGEILSRVCGKIRVANGMSAIARAASGDVVPRRRQPTGCSRDETLQTITQPCPVN